MKRVQLFGLFFLLITTTIFSQTLSSEEAKLYTLIMEYRKANGLAQIPISASLTFVAQTHVKDLNDNSPDGGSCNMHSWSDKGSWTPCCYTSDHAKAQCMWDKPSELTKYKGYGYEIAFGTSGYTANPEEALAGWKTSSGHNAVILNQSIWNTSKWQAIGIGIYSGFAVVWFGEELDE